MRKEKSDRKIVSTFFAGRSRRRDVGEFEVIREEVRRIKMIRKNGGIAEEKIIRAAARCIGFELREVFE